MLRAIIIISTVCCVAAAFAQTSSRSREKDVPIVGVSSIGEWDTLGAERPLSTEELRKTLAAAPAPRMLWRIEPGGWPAPVHPGRVDPKGDGNYRWTEIDALFDAASEAEAGVAPALTPESLAYLGLHNPLSGEPAPRARFLRELSLRYGRADIPHLQWRLPIDLSAGESGPRDVDMAQLTLDATALKAGGGITIAEVGEWSSDPAEKDLERITGFVLSSAASTVEGLSVAIRLEAPDIGSLLDANSRLLAHSFKMPVSYHDVRLSSDFALPLDDSETWTEGHARAAYRTAAASCLIGQSFGASVCLSDVASTTTYGAAPPEPLASRRWLQLIAQRPYFRANLKYDRDERVVLIRLDRQEEPPSYLVFWDWASDPDYEPGSTKPWEAKVEPMEYAATPLIEDFESGWDSTRIRTAGKTGLTLELGRSPVFFQRSRVGRPVDVPLGRPGRREPIFELDSLLP